jgi:redox-sensitive bicupin YhaK (pirin superfamily)
METVLHKADTRGYANHGWLKSFHTFSFARYIDYSRVHFGALRVLNDDIIAGGMGFGTHPHDNMEIVTIPLSGTIAHKDSTGTDGRITAGEVQIMSAGTGIQHSEFNGEKDLDLNLLQIWVLPEKRNIAPRYDQKHFGLEGRKNQWQTVVGPDEKDGAMWINQQAWFNLTQLNGGKALSYTLHGANQGAYLFVISGDVTVNGIALNQRDGLGISNTEEINLIADSNTEVLLIEVPMIKL